MPSKRKGTRVQTEVASDCRHHWIIDYSQQHESKGRCQLCGEERVFQNKITPQAKKPAPAEETVPFDDAALSGEEGSEDL